LAEVILHQGIARFYHNNTLVNVGNETTIANFDSPGDYFMFNDVFYQVGSTIG
jgi:hypothetical protein